MKINYIVLTVAIIATVLISVILLTNINSDKQDLKTITVEEFYKDIDFNFDIKNKTVTLNFKSYNDGDLIIINDYISNITYYDSSKIDKNESEHTEIQFMVEDGVKYSFFFQDNLNKTYNPQDNVEIKFHIKQYNYTKMNQEKNMIFTYIEEIYEEGFNKNYYETNRKVLLPSKSIRLI